MRVSSAAQSSDEDDATGQFTSPNRELMFTGPTWWCFLDSNSDKRAFDRNSYTYKNVGKRLKDPDTETFNYHCSRKTAAGRKSRPESVTVVTES